MANSILRDKSKLFALRIIKLSHYLNDVKKEFVLSKQVLKSGTSIGANVREAQYGQSKKDFVSKMSIALKECVETLYWLELLHESDILAQTQYESIYSDCCELKNLLVSTVKTSKERT